MPLILGTNSIKDTGYNVANSARFNDGSSDTLTRTPGSASNRRTFTISFWVKRGAISSAHQNVFSSGAYGSTQMTQVFFEATDELFFSDFAANQSQNFLLKTNRLFRDPSAWYHIFIAVDTTQGTASNRIKIYVNGVQETSFATESYPDQNFDCAINVDQVHTIGNRNGASLFFDGYLSEFVFVDGTAQAHTDVGEFDSDSGIWKPTDPSGLTFGTNGFYLNFETSAELGDDVSGNTNDFSETNLTAVDQSIDTCTNNFATMNPLDFYHNATANTQSTSSEGNLYYTVASGNKGFARSTFGVSAGKWYFEVEANSVGKGFYGVCHEGIMEDGTALQPSAVYYYEAVPDFRSGDQIITTNAVSVSAGDILGFALDMDNHALYISKNGTYMNSGNPGSGSSRTGAISELFTNGRAVLSDYGPIFANVANTSTTGGLDAKVNFGSPFYSESGGNADGNGFGNFKTAPPSGYLAFCTKNLAETGG